MDLESLPENQWTDKGLIENIFLGCKTYIEFLKSRNGILIKEPFYMNSEKREKIITHIFFMISSVVLIFYFAV